MGHALMLQLTLMYHVTVNLFRNNYAPPDHSYNKATTGYIHVHAFK